MTGHSRLAPSSAFRWVNCPLSVALGEQFPALNEHPSGPEGTAAHWVWYAMLKTHTPILGEMTPEGLPVTQEMLDGALQFTNKVFSIANPHQAMGQVRLEERSTMKGIHPVMFGTPDAEVNLLELVGEYHLIDYKFGHRSVDPFENWQLAAYVFGAFERLGLTDEQIDNAKVFFHIVQPRCFHGRPASQTWETTGKNLRHMWDKLRAAAKEAITLETAAYPKVGPWCRDCPGRRACPSLRRSAGAAMDWISRAWPMQMPPEAAGLELQHAEAMLANLEAHTTALREQVEYDIQRGEPNPYWDRERSGNGSLKWSAPAAEVIALGDLLEVDLRKSAEPQPLTPTQVKALLKKKGFDESVIDEYSVRVPGELKLVPKFDTLASRVFGAKQ